MGPDQFI
jgi:hypothetical protein